MESIFDLATSTDQLESSNHGINRELFEQVSATRDITGNNFPNGQINFKFQTGSSKWWIPSRSYFRFRIGLTRGNTFPASTGSDLAPIMNFCSGLFQSGEVRLNDKTISRIADYFPQIDTLATRLNKSSSWIDSVGNSTNWWQSQFQVRQEQVSYEGVVANTGVDEEKTREELGFDGTTTVAYDSASGVITFALGTIPNVSTLFREGDFIDLTRSTGVRERFTLTNSRGADTLTVEKGRGDIVAAVSPFRRIRTINVARQVTYFEVTWTPNMSIFKVDRAIPAGRWEVILNPQTSSVYQLAVAESIDNAKVAGDLADQFKMNVENMYLYIATVQGKRVDSMTYYLDLEQYTCQAESNISPAFGQKQFDVSPSTKALCLAFQDARAGTNTLYSPTVFKSYAANTGTLDVGTTLNRLFINYSGVSKPTIDADPRYYAAYASTAGAGGRDNMTQRYIESLINSGSYHDTGGSETIEDWRQRGPYYLFNFSKDQGDRSTRCSVHTGFAKSEDPSAPNLDLSNMRMLLFSISSQIAKVVIENGDVTSVQIEDN